VGDTAVLSAAISNKTEAFKYLFEKFKVPESDKMKLVNKAVYNSNIEMLKFLEEKGFDISSPNLFTMVRKKIDEKRLLKAIDFLLKKGADINITNKKGVTSLMEAVFTEKNEVLEFLLKNGADPEVKDKSGKTALDWAKEKKNADAIKILEKAVSEKKEEKSEN